jgi:glutathionyl-hydroquinone reductase
MGPSPSVFSLGSERGDDGSFRRQVSSFREFVSDEGGDCPVQSGRYHLYVARACPWAHRTLIGRALMGLQEAISVSFVDPIRDERGWRFSGGGYVDPVNGFGYLSEAYLAAEPDYAARVTVPVLWDKRRATIVNNESADILRMLSTAFAPLAEHPVELVPERLRGEIEALNRLIYENVNNAV